MVTRGTAVGATTATPTEPMSFAKSFADSLKVKDLMQNAPMSSAKPESGRETSLDLTHESESRAGIPSTSVDKSVEDAKPSAAPGLVSPAPTGATALPVLPPKVDAYEMVGLPQRQVAPRPVTSPSMERPAPEQRALAAPVTSARMSAKTPANLVKPEMPARKVSTAQIKEPDVAASSEKNAAMTVALHPSEAQRASPHAERATVVASPNEVHAAAHAPTAVASNVMMTPTSTLVPLQPISVPNVVGNSSIKQADPGGRTAIRGVLKTAPGSVPKADAEHEELSSSTLPIRPIKGGSESSHEAFRAVASEPTHDTSGADPNMPASAVVASLPSLITSGSGTLKGDGVPHAEAALRAAGNASEISEPRTLVASANALEVGVGGGSHGWLRVRAELGHTGEVKASLIASSAGSVTALSRELGALTEFLRSESVGVTSLAVTAPERHSAMHGATTGSGSASEGGGRSGKESRHDAQGLSGKAQPEKVWDEAALASWPLGMSVPVAGGSWLNVRV